MKCVIECMCPLRNKINTITLKDGKIFVDDGRYERLILNNEDEVDGFYEKLYKNYIKRRMYYEKLNP